MVTFCECSGRYYIVQIGICVADRYIMSTGGKAVLEMNKANSTTDKLIDSVRASLSNRDASIKELLKKPEAKRPPLVTFDPATGTAKLNAPKSAIDALGNIAVRYPPGTTALLDATTRSTYSY